MFRHMNKIVLILLNIEILAMLFCQHFFFVLKRDNILNNYVLIVNTLIRIKLINTLIRIKYFAFGDDFLVGEKS